MPIKKITREDILLKSREVIRKHGYFNTSMNDLAAACGLYKGSFYHHFASKEALMTAILEDFRHSLKDQVFSVIDDNTLLPKERLATLFQKFSEVFLYENGGCFIGNTTLEAAQHVPEFAEILRGIFSDWIEALQKLYATNHPTDVAEKLAQQTIAEFEGAIMLSNLFKDRTYIKDGYKRAMARFD